MRVSKANQSLPTNPNRNALSTSTMKPGSVSFPNWQSRLLLSRAAKRQSIKEAEVPALASMLLHAYERFILHVNHEKISLDRPIFLLGLPRSGTTMLQDLLCAHPHVAYFTNTMNRFPDHFCAIESIRKKLNLNFKAERYLRDSVEITTDSPSDALTFWGRWLGMDPYSPSYQPIDPTLLTEAKVKEVHTTIRKAIWSFGPPWRRFFSKLLAPLPHLDVVRQLFPDACFIHIIRDGRMTANSMLKLCQREIEQQDRYAIHGKIIRKSGQYFIPYPRFPRLKEYLDIYGILDIRTTAHLWNDAIDYIDSIKSSFDNYYEVKFEDILANPHHEVSAILKFCSLNSVPPESRVFWEKIEGVGVVGHLNHYEGFEMVEEICASNLRKFGYL